MVTRTHSKRFYATGRRKTSVARVWIEPGKGDVTVNGRQVMEHFRRETLKMVIEQPMETVSLLGKLNIFATVNGGGLAGQAGALRRGNARRAVLDRHHLMGMKQARRQWRRRIELVEAAPVALGVGFARGHVLRRHQHLEPVEQALLGQGTFDLVAQGTTDQPQGRIGICQGAHQVHGSRKEGVPFAAHQVLVVARFAGDEPDHP